jgi:hypothetical protein
MCDSLFAGLDVKIGYARTSTFEQVAGLEAQERELRSGGAEKVFSERVCHRWPDGTSSNPPSTGRLTRTLPMSDCCRRMWSGYSDQFMPLGWRLNMRNAAARLRIAFGHHLAGCPRSSRKGPSWKSRGDSRNGRGCARSHKRIVADFRF